MNKYFAVKMSTPFGTYTMGTYARQESAELAVEALKSNGKRARIEVVDGAYNGPVRLPDSAIVK